MAAAKVHNTRNGKRVVNLLYNDEVDAATVNDDESDRVQAVAASRRSRRSPRRRAAALSSPAHQTQPVVCLVDYEEEDDEDDNNQKNGGIATRTTRSQTRQVQSTPTKSSDTRANQKIKSKRDDHNDEDDKVEVLAHTKRPPTASSRSKKRARTTPTKDPPRALVPTAAAVALGSVVEKAAVAVEAVARKPATTMVFDSDDSDDDVAMQEVVVVSSRNLKRGDDTNMSDEEEEEVQVVKKPPLSARERRRQKRESHQAENPPVEQHQAENPPVEQQPYQKVLEVFPDAQLEHVQNLLQQHKDDTVTVISFMAEQGYPKAENHNLKAPPDGANVTIERPASSLPENAPKLDFYSKSSFTPSNVYKKEVVLCIQYAFPFLTLAGARVHLREADSHYAVCHDQIRKLLVGTPTRGTKRKKTPEKAASKEDKEAEEERQFACWYKVFKEQVIDKDQKARLQLKSTTSLTRQSTFSSPPNPVTITDPTLKEEVAFVERQMKTWKQTIKRRLSLRNAREACIKNGTAVSCNCCFDDFALEEMIACREEGHLFCTDCVASYAENQIFGVGNFGVNCKTKKPAMELLCMHGDGCSSGFQVAQLRKAMSDKVLAKYDELQFQKAVDCANMDDLCTCPKCGFQAALAESEMIFHCPVSDCRFESCRKCGEEAHIPLRCDEVEKKVETNGRITVEEAISKAKIRTCPKCHKSFIKSDGCNKVPCACGTLVCYVCRKQIKGYDHFCQTPHCKHVNCKKCKLYSNAEEDDKIAMRDAGLTAAEQVRQISHQQQQQEQQKKVPGSAKAAPTPAVEVNVDVEQLLRDPSEKQNAKSKK